jgi:hypothetical protein
MQKKEQPNNLQSIILELERKYPYFKKMDIYSTVSNAYKKIHNFFSNDAKGELEEIRRMAERELSL